MNIIITNENMALCQTLTEVDGRLYVQDEGASFPALGRVIAFSTWALVLLRDGRLSAGCRGPFTRQQALQHWDRSDARAQLFTAAIRALPEGEGKP